jgi:hypothetical protein
MEEPLSPGMRIKKIFPISPGKQRSFCSGTDAGHGEGKRIFLLFRQLCTHIFSVFVVDECFFCCILVEVCHHAAVLPGGHRGRVADGLRRSDALQGGSAAIINNL